MSHSGNSFFQLPTPGLREFFLEDMRNLLEIPTLYIWGKGGNKIERRKKIQLYPRGKTSNISAARVKAFLILATMEEEKNLFVCFLPNVWNRIQLVTITCSLMLICSHLPNLRRRPVEKSILIFYRWSSISHFY